MSEDNITTATEGVEFSLDMPYQDRKITVPYTVGPKCPHGRGHWICTTHRETFGANIEKDSHYRSLKSEPHVMAWCCDEGCGPVVP